jgi:large subunit ribosomal protein L30
MSQVKQLKLTLVRSTFGQLKMHRDCVRGLGLRKMHSSVTVAATPQNLGMIRNSGFMLKVEEV